MALCGSLRFPSFFRFLDTALPLSLCLLPDNLGKGFGSFMLMNMCVCVSFIDAEALGVVERLCGD